MLDDAKEPERTPSKEGYRFTGYNLPSIRLDDGFDYYYVAPHPTLFNQPMVWQEPAYTVGFDTAGGNVEPLFSGDNGSRGFGPVAVKAGSKTSISIQKEQTQLPL